MGRHRMGNWWGAADGQQEIEIPIVGADGKYLPTVSTHKDEGADVAAN